MKEILKRARFNTILLAVLIVLTIPEIVFKTVAEGGWNWFWLVIAVAASTSLIFDIIDFGKKIKICEYEDDMDIFEEESIPFETKKNKYNEE